MAICSNDSAHQYGSWKLQTSWSIVDWRSSSSFINFANSIPPNNPTTLPLDSSKEYLRLYVFSRQVECQASFVAFLQVGFLFLVRKFSSQGGDPNEP